MKKAVSLLLSIALLFILLLPAQASSNFTEVYNHINISEDCDNTPIFDETSELGKAYISFSDKVTALGVPVKTCYEDFVLKYRQTPLTGLQQYIEASIDAELLAFSAQPFSIENSSNTLDTTYIDAKEAQKAGLLSFEELNLLTSYENLLSYLSQKNFDANLPYSIFVESYNASNFNNAQDYADSIASTYNARTSLWQDNIGTSSPALSQQASYSKYNILSTVQKGDIVQETAGGIATITGHIAIVEGQFWDSSFRQSYIRLIESGTSGVVYGVLDDERYEVRGINVYNVTNATSTQKTQAISFCISQLGKPYNWTALSAAVVAPGVRVHLSSDGNRADSWYCSELVWAAYYNQGINFNGEYPPCHIYYPSTLASSSLLSRRTIR